MRLPHQGQEQDVELEQGREQGPVWRPTHGLHRQINQARMGVAAVMPTGTLALEAKLV